MTQRAQEIIVVLPIHEEDARRFTESGVPTQVLGPPQLTGNTFRCQERLGLCVDSLLGDLVAHGFILWRVTLDTTFEPVLALRFQRGSQLPPVTETDEDMVRAVAEAYVYLKLEAIACESGSLLVRLEEAFIGSVDSKTQHVRLTPTETIRCHAIA